MYEVLSYSHVPVYTIVSLTKGGVVLSYQLVSSSLHKNKYRQPNGLPLLNYSKGHKFLQ